MHSCRFVLTDKIVHVDVVAEKLKQKKAVPHRLQTHTSSSSGDDLVLSPATIKSDHQDTSDQDNYDLDRPTSDEEEYEFGEEEEIEKGVEGSDDDVSELCHLIQKALSIETGLPADHHRLLNIDEFITISENSRSGHQNQKGGDDENDDDEKEKEKDDAKEGGGVNGNVGHIPDDDHDFVISSLEMNDLISVNNDNIGTVGHDKSVQEKGQITAEFEWQVALKISGGKGEFGRALKNQGRKFRQDQMRTARQQQQNTNNTNNNNAGFRNLQGRRVLAGGPANDQENNNDGNNNNQQQPRFRQAQRRAQAQQQQQESGINNNAQQNQQQPIIAGSSNSSIDAPTVNLIERERLRVHLSAMVAASVNVGFNTVVKKIAVAEKKS